MSTLTISIDDRTTDGLKQLGEQGREDVSVVAARLLSRAVRAARARPSHDIASLKATYAEFVEEDLALAESGAEERRAWLHQEDVVLGSV